MRCWCWKVWWRIAGHRCTMKSSPWTIARCSLIIWRRDRIRMCVPRYWNWCRPGPMLFAPRRNTNRLRFVLSSMILEIFIICCLSHWVLGYHDHTKGSGPRFSGAEGGGRHVCHEYRSQLGRWEGLPSLSCGIHAHQSQTSLPQLWSSVLWPMHDATVPFAQIWHRKRGKHLAFTAFQAHILNSALIMFDIYVLGASLWWLLCSIAEAKHRQGGVWIFGIRITSRISEQLLGSASAGTHTVWNSFAILL